MRAESDDELVLASGSPRRHQLLQMLGVAHVVRPVHIEEQRRSNESPADYAQDSRVWRASVMLAALHLGRDAPVAAALMLDLLSRTGRTVAECVEARPRYAIVKAKADRGADLDRVYAALRARFGDAGTDGLDGLRLYWDDRWLHVRPSGTEPIVRMIAEAGSAEVVDDAAKQFGVAVARAKVGEANVARAMRDAGAIVGGSVPAHAETARPSPGELRARYNRVP